MSTLTIVKIDGSVSRDGVGFAIDCSSLASNIHAIQWDGSAGEVEYTDGTVNTTIDSIAAYSSITDAYATAKSEADSAATTLANAQTAQENTYQFKRVHDATTRYADVNEQLDQQYHDAVNSTTTWKDAITAVKVAHPKP